MREAERQRRAAERLGELGVNKEDQSLIMNDLAYAEELIGVANPICEKIHDEAKELFLSVSLDHDLNQDLNNIKISAIESMRSLLCALCDANKLIKKEAARKVSH